MTLDEYLNATETTNADFGQKLGVSEVSVWRIRHGKQNITRDLMLAIIEASNGKVSADGLLVKAS